MYTIPIVITAPYLLYWYISHDAMLRKMTSDTISKLHESSSSSSNTAPISNFYDANRFMPKVKIIRPDGASLRDVYESKRQDIWAKILHEQVIEEEQSNIIKKGEKIEADAEYQKYSLCLYIYIYI